MLIRLAAAVDRMSRSEVTVGVHEVTGSVQQVP